MIIFFSIVLLYMIVGIMEVLKIGFRADDACTIDTLLAFGYMVKIMQVMSINAKTFTILFRLFHP